MRAANFGHVESIQVLLDRGADLEAKDEVSPPDAPPTCRPAGAVRGCDAGSCSAGRGRPAARAAGPGARTGKRRVQGRVRGGRGLRLIVGPTLTFGLAGVAGVRAGRCRVARPPSSGLPGTDKWRPRRCCWTAAPTWWPRAKSAHWLRLRHVALPASSEVAMRPAAVPGVVGLLLGRRVRERAPGSGASRGVCGAGEGFG